MEEKNLKIIEEEAQKLLESLKVKASLSTQVDEQGAVHLSLESEEAALLIGYHGQTLASLQLIFNLMIYKKLGQWVKIFLNVGDWRQKREEALQNMALKIAERVELTGEPAFCPYLSASDRRIIHLVLQGHPKVETESQGEGEDRRLIVKLKS